MKKTIPLTCPDCDRKLRPGRLMRHATEIRTRTCRCGARWQIKLTPTVRPGAVFTVLDWTRRTEVAQ